MWFIYLTAAWVTGILLCLISAYKCKVIIPVDEEMWNEQEEQEWADYWNELSDSTVEDFIN